MENVRTINKQLVVEKALNLFIESGIEHTKIKDIAKAAKLTERSIYRYFDTKADIVQAAAYLFYEYTTKRVYEEFLTEHIKSMSGIEQIRVLLYKYGDLYFFSPKGVKFTLEAEVYLFNEGKKYQVLNKPPERFEASNSPLVMAIKNGLKDGTVSDKVDVRMLYYNAYESILGVMQKMEYGSDWLLEASLEEKKDRMKQLCDVFVKAFQGN